MTKKDIEGFFGNSFFVALKPESFNSEYAESELKKIVKQEFNKNYDAFYENLFQSFQFKFDRSYRYNEDYVDLIKQVVINFFLEHDMLEVFCSDDEYAKIKDIFKRNQFNSKVFALICNRVGFFLHFIRINEQNLLMLLSNDISRKIDEYNENYILKEVGPFKRIVDKVASGVKNQCYLDFIRRPFPGYPTEEMLDYIKDKHGFDLKSKESSYELQNGIARVLSLALINDEEFWKLEHGDRNIFSFLSIVEHYNDIKHAEKIVDYAFAEACKNEKVKFLYDNKLPLFFCYDLEGQMASDCAFSLQRQFDEIFDIKLSQKDINGFIYPLYSGYDNFINEGKQIFEGFIKNAYKADSSLILKLFTDLSNVIQDEEKVTRLVTRKELNLHEYLEFELVGWDLVKEKEEYLSKRYNNYENDESVLGRFYYRIYIINKYAKEQAYECIYEYIYSMLSMIDKKYGTLCSYALDTSFRDNCYNQLKDIMKKHNIIINDEFKELYIIALLDRKYATPNEADMFAELEQFGDAIYELAVDNILFYNPNSEESLSHELREEYVKADAQIVVSKAIGFDKLYISKLHNSLNNKYIDNEDIAAGLRGSDVGNYIADSLEMIIGVVAKEFGIQKALDFATDIIVEANSNLQKPVFIENFDVVALYNSNYDMDYLNKIYPSPFLIEDFNYREDYHTLSYALNKILKIAIIGNDTKEKRKMIANFANRLMPNEEPLGYYKYVVAYLYYGIEATIEKYRPIVESSYRENKEN